MGRGVIESGVGWEDGTGQEEKVTCSQCSSQPHPRRREGLHPTASTRCEEAQETAARHHQDDQQAVQQVVEEERPPASWPVRPPQERNNSRI